MLLRFNLVSESDISIAVMLSNISHLTLNDDNGQVILVLKTGDEFQVAGSFSSMIDRINAAHAAEIGGKLDLEVKKEYET